MPDRDNVIKGLECCKNGGPINPNSFCGKCPYDPERYSASPCFEHLKNDVIELLKKQAEGEMLAGIVADIKAGRVRRFAGDGFEVVRCES